MNRKLINILLIASLVTLCLAGCGGNSPELQAPSSSSTAVGDIPSTGTGTGTGGGSEAALGGILGFSQSTLEGAAIGNAFGEGAAIGDAFGSLAGLLPEEEQAERSAQILAAPSPIFAWHGGEVEQLGLTGADAVPRMGYGLYIYELPGDLVSNDMLIALEDFNWTCFGKVESSLL
jgi:hypothetical protein